MEINVCNALNAYITPIISLLSKLAPKPATDGVSNAAPTVITPVGQETPNLNPPTCLVNVMRKSKTKDGILGLLQVDGVLVCKTIENLDKAIEPGTYTARIDLSPRLQYLCPHLIVPDRDQAAGGDAGIRIHIANTPDQVEGCIAVGLAWDNDSVDSSKLAFDKLMALLPQDQSSFVVVVSS